MKEERKIWDFDLWLVLIALAISGLGILEIYSATHNNNLAGMHLRQLGWVGLGVACLLVISRIDYHAILDQAPLLYLGGLAALVAVLLFGEVRFGARRWLSVGGLPLQVSELLMWP